LPPAAVEAKQAVEAERAKFIVSGFGSASRKFLFFLLLAFGGGSFVGGRRQSLQS
jgi:hypothetical protein